MLLMREDFVLSGQLSRIGGDGRFAFGVTHSR